LSDWLELALLFRRGASPLTELFAAREPTLFFKVQAASINRLNTLETCTAPLYGEQRRVVKGHCLILTLELTRAVLGVALSDWLGDVLLWDNWFMWFIDNTTNL
jgi:hypothetical protein